ncbi:hypothetical protein PPL_02263 [Heterostelium album PN500]|uniref:E3 ubiquitin-protein ligase UBR-like C-terminal domain-containing protein n=1 Tax=Heterostelium pallidum (strain ATCC 26659 / Pp 5 / PN500) TaxID=670386 RepID=D3B1T9_HETP5|nr:hypothetical protein PPL_02263 [Heterostelium album PN500]EFA85263.1 hypothetical protein PPL_02263 [Heterostelium album PN500]|eukprot:XP_020437372.1 hypothetical protein PPL_02263 [Heterostelium album PN500]
MKVAPLNSCKKSSTMRQVCLHCGSVICTNPICCPNELTIHTQLCQSSIGLFIKVGIPEVSLYLLQYEIKKYNVYHCLKGESNSTDSSVLNAEVLRELYISWLSGELHQNCLNLIAGAREDQ